MNEQIKSNLELLERQGIPFIWKDKNIGFVEVQVNGYIVYLWLSTGTYRNPHTGAKGKGIYNFFEYYTQLLRAEFKREIISSEPAEPINFNTDTSISDNPDNSTEYVDTPENRIKLLELTIDSLLERVAILEQQVFKDETKHS